MARNHFECNTTRHGVKNHITERRRKINFVLIIGFEVLQNVMNDTSRPAKPTSTEKVICDRHISKGG